ncbi:MAG: hypothetical protein JWL64_2627 [Frankiales bacterium]|nr:hypothetical protein [Frankiales bacterium]
MLTTRPGSQRLPAPQGVRLSTRWRQRRWLLIPALLYAAAAWWLTRHLWADPGQLVVADNPHDSALFAWFLTETPHALARGELPLHTDLMNHPDGVNLMWNTPVPLVGVLMAPLTAWFGGLWAVTFLTAAGPFLSAGSALAVARRFDVARTAAVLGGLFYGFSPAMTAKSVGHLNLTMQPLLPVLLLLGIRLATRPGPAPRTAVLLGALATAQVLVNEELLLLTGLALALVLLALLITERPAVAHLRAVTAGYGTALAVFALTAGPLLLYQLRGPQHGSGALYTGNYFKVDLASVVVPSRLQLLASDASASRALHFTGGLTEQTGFLGWPLVVLALGALAFCGRDLRVRATLLPVLVLTGLALGEVLAVDGSNTGHALPWSFVARTPLVENVLASRLPLLSDLLLAAGLCFAAQHLGRRYGPAAGLSACLVWAVALVPTVPAPLRAAPAPATPEFFTAATSPVLDLPGSVLVLPFPTGTQTAPLLWQAASGMVFAMPGGYFIGPADDGHLYVGGQPRASQALFTTIAETGASPPVTTAVRATVLADLAHWQARAVVLGPGPHAAELATFVTQVLGRGPAPQQGVLVWRVG